MALHDEEYEQEYYDPIPELTLKQAANSLLRDGLRVFQRAEWNQDGAHRYTITDNSNVSDVSEGAPDFSFHAEFFVVLPGVATRFTSEDVPIIWEVRDQHLRDAYLARLKEANVSKYVVTDLNEREKNVDILEVYYISEYEDWQDGEGNPMRKVIGLKPFKVRFLTPLPMYGYVAARRFNAFLEVAVKKSKATWLDGLYFKVNEGILGLNDKDDFNYVAEMTDSEEQTDAIEMILVTPEELLPRVDTSKAKPDISPKEKRIDELEAMFESYIRTHPDAPKDYMTVSIVMGLSDEYYALLEEFGEL